VTRKCGYIQCSCGFRSIDRVCPLGQSQSHTNLRSSTTLINSTIYVKYRLSCSLLDFSSLWGPATATAPIQRPSLPMGACSPKCAWISLTIQNRLHPSSLIPFAPALCSTSVPTSCRTPPPRAYPNIPLNLLSHEAHKQRCVIFPLLRKEFGCLAFCLKQDFDFPIVLGLSVIIPKNFVPTRRLVMRSIF